MKFEQELKRLFIPLILPALILYVTFFVVPALQGIPFTFTDYTPYNRVTNFVGLDNYRRLPDDAILREAFGNTLKFAVLGFVQLPLQLFFAVVLTLRVPLKRPLTAIIFLPAIMSVVVTSLIWFFIYNPVFGLLNEALRFLGLEGWTHAWLGERATVIPAVAAMGIWQSIGGGMILFLAGLKKIPRDLYDAARIDGAGTWGCFRYITWPLLWEITRLLLILYVIGSLQTFGGPFVMTRGGPGNQSLTLTLYLYNRAFDYGYQYYYAATIGVLIFVMVMAATVLMYRFTGRETVEY